MTEVCLVGNTDSFEGCKKRKCRRRLSCGRREMIRNLLEREVRPEVHLVRRPRDTPFVTKVYLECLLARRTWLKNWE